MHMCMFTHAHFHTHTHPQNIDIDDLVLNPEEIEAIAQLDCGWSGRGCFGGPKVCTTFP